MVATTKTVSSNGNEHASEEILVRFQATQEALASIEDVSDDFLSEHEKRAFLARLERADVLGLADCLQDQMDHLQSLEIGLVLTKGDPSAHEHVKRDYAATSWKILAIHPIFKRRKEFESRRKMQPVHYTSADYISALSDLGYAFKMNEMGDVIEVNGKPLTDPMRSVIRSRIRDRGLRGMDAMEDAYIAEAYANRYHPVQQYLSGLEWNNEPNIATLSKHFDNPDKSFSIWLRRWLIGAVAKAFLGEQNPMLVLDGPQGKGKSTFARWLCPLPEYFIESPITPDDNDSAVRLISRWIWEVSELGSTVRRSDREALKAFISQQTVTVRKSYGRSDTIKPALASMIGTVNNENGILSDPTGSRRFLVCLIEGIDWAYTELDVSQVWAEAHHAFEHGERWTLSQAENDLAREINETYEVDDPISAMISKFFRLDKESDAWTSSLEILTILQDAGLRGTTRANSMAIASAMKRLGFEGIRRYENGGRIRGYDGVARK